MQKMFQPLSTLPLSDTAILELGKYACQYVEDVENSKDLGNKFEGKLSVHVPRAISALDLWQEELRRDHLTTFCDALDNILDGGFQCTEITEICGAYGSGKSQICMQMSIVTQLPKECGGLNSQSLYIDTRNSFSPTRVQALFVLPDISMGVKGLTTYVNSCKELLEQYELHDGYVVIDGDSLAINLYKTSTKPHSPQVHCNCAFGGDYNIYVGWVEDFFDKLEKWNVTPLVIMDGGWEDKKMKTLTSRRKSILGKALNYTPSQQSKNQFLPINAIHAFATCLLRRKTKIVRSVFENDPCIAGVAKILDCPVLSLDSDFYIFGVKYISLEDLDRCARRTNANQQAINCPMFEVENLLRMFPGLEHSVLPLLAVLLGNDYVEAKFFQDFFDYLGLLDTNKNLDELTRKIDVILAWLSERTLNVAVAAILSTLPVQYRRKVLDSIHLVVNGYLVLPFDMLTPLGLTSNDQGQMLPTRQQKKFNFRGNIDKLEARHYWGNYTINEISNLSDIETELPFCMQSNDGNRSTTFVNTLPLWFKREYSNTKFPSFFVTMIFHRLFVCPIQIEDPEKPSAAAMSLNLIRVIDGLLVAGREEAYRDLTYVIREKRSLVFQKVRTVCGVNSIDFPPLVELPFTPFGLRKQIFEETLEISDKRSLLKDIPPEWRLFIVTALYWINPIDEPPPNTCHIYALLFTMLLGVVDEKFGKYRTLIRTKTTYKVEANKIKLAQRNELKSLKNKKGKKKNKANNESGDSIIEALRAVTDTDCLIAARFFLKNYQADEMLFRNSDNFDVTIVHAFSQFQCCLRYATNLNGLLGYPYKHPVIGKLYNGTMLYNLYIQFEQHFNAETYIAKILQKTPSLLRLLTLLIDKMKILVDRPIANGYREKSFARERSEAIVKKNPKKGKKGDNIFEKSEKMLYENEAISSSEESDDESSEDIIEDIQHNFKKYTKIYTLKAEKLLYREFTDFHSGRGVTKRKNKKQRSKQFFDDY